MSPTQSAKNLMSADQNDAAKYMRTVDSSSMYNYVLKRSAMGALAGLGVSGALVTAGVKYSPRFKRSTNVPVRSFFMMAGTAVGFTIASDKALTHYLRHHDRPEITAMKDE